MSLINMKHLLSQAQKSDWAVGSFSVANMEMILGVLQACEERRSPCILQIAEVRLKQSPLELIGPMMVAAAENADIPVAVHFDHGKTKDAIKKALDIGFTSVMYDGSHLDFEENLSQTMSIKELADSYGAATEAEIGCVGGSEDGSENIAINCTSPEQAERFAYNSSVDALAIAIGNAHGNYKSAPKLRFDILEKVRDRVSVPLVLHGGTGIMPEDFVRCRKNGIKKINIATATFDSVEFSVRDAYASDNIKGYYDLQSAEVRGAYLNAMKHIEIFGSYDKSNLFDRLED